MIKYTFNRSPYDSDKLNKWVDGLRNGGYKQARGVMADRTLRESSCCLHVAAMVVDGAAWEEGFGMPGPHERWGFSGDVCQASIKVQKGGGINYRSFDYLNDSTGLSFNQIADLVEHGTLVVVET